MNLKRNVLITDVLDMVTYMGLDVDSFKDSISKTDCTDKISVGEVVYILNDSHCTTDIINWMENEMSAVIK